MRNKKPPFEINEKIMTYVIDIAELLGKISVKSQISSNPTLRRTNRIRTIYSSLAIEQNTLDIDQVTAVLSGKGVIAPPKDIAEVQNAYEIYECMDSLNPYSVDDLLKAHGILKARMPYTLVYIAYQHLLLNPLYIQYIFPKSDLRIFCKTHQEMYEPCTRMISLRLGKSYFFG